MILLFTDFGERGPYLGQMQAALHLAGCREPVFNIHADLPVFQPQAAAYLLAAYVTQFPPDSIFLCVVDPGVGSTRRPIVMRCAERWFVGPDNGLFDIVAQHFPDPQCWHIEWHLQTEAQAISNTFHGRDLFAPTAARLSQQNLSGLRPYTAPTSQGWADDAASIIYLDHYGNAYTAWRMARLPNGHEVSLTRNGQTQHFTGVRTYSDAPSGSLVYYENSLGLLELAQVEGNLADTCHLNVGMPITLLRSI